MCYIVYLENCSIGLLKNDWRGHEIVPSPIKVSTTASDARNEDSVVFLLSGYFVNIIKHNYGVINHTRVIIWDIKCL
jgi:hypothetical protein